ncbi:hypothetical protein CHU98_g8479 [Xylaria longipes]|nr:hypothetical protein CHU98_g8479 [Xylaria longipes]
MKSNQPCRTPYNRDDQWTANPGSQALKLQVPKRHIRSLFPPPPLLEADTTDDIGFAPQRATRPSSAKEQGLLWAGASVAATIMTPLVRSRLANAALVPLQWPTHIASSITDLAPPQLSQMLAVFSHLQSGLNSNFLIFPGP